MRSEEWWCGAQGMKRREFYMASGKIEMRIISPDGEVISKRYPHIRET